jgi:hypothetical protein
MNLVRVDWHIHTTLSPCGSLAMDAGTILQKARERGLDVIGITDHNSTRQGRLIKTENPGNGPVILTGAEVTTREEIHCLAFFDDFLTLDEFQEYLDRHLPGIKNNPDYFGDQVVVNRKGEIVYQEDKLLISALDRSLNEVAGFVGELGGIFIPAHVNRPSYSILSQLGFIPEGLRADALEWVPEPGGDTGLCQRIQSSGYQAVYSSDAHHPSQIGQRYSELALDVATFDTIRQALRNGIINRCTQ